MQPSSTPWVTQLAHRGFLTIKGPDAKTFLQGQITCNLNDINTSQSHLAAHCNLKGRIQSLFRVYLFDEQNSHYLLAMPINMVPLALANFKKYALFSKVEMMDDSAAFHCYGIGGKGATQQIATLFDNALIPLLTVDGCSPLTKELNLGLICRVWGDETRYEIVIPQPLAAPLWDKMRKKFEVVDENQWELTEIQAGIPTIYPNTVDAIIPHHLNLTNFNGISFNKGCYLGQEIIARMHYRGKIKKHLYQAVVNGVEQAPKAGDQVISANSGENEAPGVVVRAALNAEGKYLMLVVLDEQQAEGPDLHLHSKDGPSVLRVSTT